MKKLILISALAASVASVYGQSSAPKGVEASSATSANLEEPAAPSTIQTYMTEATKVFTAMQANPKKRIPDEVLAEADAILMARVNSGALIIGASEGKGFATKNNIDNWSPPAFYTLSAGSLGIQIGGTSSDVIILFMNSKAADLLYKSEFQIGVGLQAEAGPVGGEASLNTWQDADMLIYNTTKGLAVGVKVAGGKLTSDTKLDAQVYGDKNITATQILGNTVTMPPEAKDLTNLLREYSFVNTQPENAKAGQ